MSALELSKIYVQNKAEAERLLNYSFAICALSKWGLPAPKWREMYKQNPKRAEFLAQHGYMMLKLFKQDKLSLEQLMQVYDQKTELFDKHGYGIVCLSESSLSALEWNKLHDHNPEKAEFFAQNSFDISALCRNNFSVQQLIEKYDKDPRVIELLAQYNLEIHVVLEDVKHSKQDPKLTPEDILNCNSEQLTQLLNKEITPEQLKESLIKNEAQKHGNKELQKQDILKQAQAISSGVLTTGQNLEAINVDHSTRARRYSANDVDKLQHNRLSY